MYDVHNYDTRHSSIKCRYAECHYSECRDYWNVMLSVVRPNVVMLSVVTLSVLAPVWIIGALRFVFLFRFSVILIMKNCCWKKVFLSRFIKSSEACLKHLNQNQQSSHANIL